MTFGLPWIDYFVIFIYLIIMVGIGVYFSRMMKGGKDFFVGGNLIPWWVAGVSLYMTMFSAWTFTGAASFTYNTGWYGIIFFSTWPLSFFIGFQMSARKWRRARVTSPVEYVKSRFNKTTHMFLTIIMVLSSAYWPAQHLASLGKICAPTLFPNSMLAIDIMIIVAGIIIMFYTFSGGLWAVCITDVVQFLILVSVCIVLIPTAFLSNDLGSISNFISKIPELKFHHVLSDGISYDYWYLLGIPATYLFSYAVGANAQRYFSVKDEKSAKNLGWLAFVLFCFGPLLFGIPPLIGKVLWPDINMLHYFSQVTKPDENIYIAVVLKYMPAGVVGIFLAAMMSASMSAMDSAWNAVSAMISLDIYKNIFRPNASEEEVLKVGRFSVVLLCVMAIAMALTIIHSSYSIFSFSNIFFGLTGVPIAIPLLLGIISRKMSRWSAISSILAGTLMASTAKFALNYTLGPQYLITVAITLLFVFASAPLAQLYTKSKNQALLVNVTMGVLLWLFFLNVNLNPNLSLSSFGTIFENGFLNILKTSAFWVSVTSILLVVLSQKFSKLYAKDLLEDQTELNAFFKKMDTPVDVEKEVMVEGAKEVNVFPLVGGVSILIGLLSLLLLINPQARANVFVNVSITGLLVVIGLLMLFSNKIQKIFAK